MTIVRLVLASLLLTSTLVPLASATPACATTRDAVWHARQYFLNGDTFEQVEDQLRGLDCPPIDLEDVYCDIHPFADICNTFWTVDHDLFYPALVWVLHFPGEAYEGTGLPAPGDLVSDEPPASYPGKKCQQPRFTPKHCDIVSAHRA